MLSYIADNPQVQLGFLLVFAICFVAFLVNYRIGKAQFYKREEDQEARRDRIMSLEGRKSVPQTVEHSG